MTARPFAWEKSYPPGLEWDVPLVIGTLSAMFDASIAAYGTRPAIEFRGRQMSYAELGDAATFMACGLMSLGHDKSRPVALFAFKVGLPLQLVRFTGEVGLFGVGLRAYRNIFARRHGHRTCE